VRQSLFRLSDAGASLSHVFISLLSSYVFVSQAKTAKIVRTVIEIVCEVPDALEVQIGLCEQVVAWCLAERRSFLRQRVQSKLAALLLKAEKYTESLALASKLIKELKKLDDKQLLVETHLVEARIQHAIRNVPKAKAALTTARTNGNAIYVVPLLQGELDAMSGNLCCEEGDYNTAYSYFLEAFEGFANVNGSGKDGDPRASACLKHMMLCKVLQGSADEVPGIAAKWGLKQKNVKLDGLVAIAKAAKKRSLEDFDAASTQ
jgi:26S proteasome regulatory subunit N6